MNILFINPAWDAAGCSYRQAAAINKYTTHKARHYRAVKTFYDTLDIGMENYNRDEFVSIIEQSDILHFCSAVHTYPSPQVWGFDWNDYISKKKTIFHDYNSFPGYWGDRWRTKDCWNKLKEIGYNAIFSSIPQAMFIYDKCNYIPDLVDEQDEWFTPDPNRDMLQINLCHFPTGGGNNKNTTELQTALSIYNIRHTITQGISNKEVLAIKKKHNFGFDALWRGFHGATSVENLALGIPTMCNIEPQFEETFKATFQTDILPFEKVQNIPDIINTLRRYSDVDVLKERCAVVRKFMEEKWSAKNVAEMIIKEYEKL
jgi:hypothetical protein